MLETINYFFFVGRRVIKYFSTPNPSMFWQHMKWTPKEGWPWAWVPRKYLIVVVVGFIMSSNSKMSNPCHMSIYIQMVPSVVALHHWNIPMKLFPCSQRDKKNNKIAVAHTVTIYFRCQHSACDVMQVPGPPTFVHTFSFFFE